MSTETLIVAGLILAIVLLLRGRGRRSRHSRLYDWYMKSHLWRLRRWLWYWTSDRKCEECGHRMVLHARGYRHRWLRQPVVTVHHKNYRRLGHEHRSDVSLLCWPCHSRKDSWRHR